MGRDKFWALSGNALKWPTGQLLVLLPSINLLEINYLRQMTCELLLLGNNLRQIGELWIHLSELDLKKKLQNVSKLSHALTSNRTPRQCPRCSIFSSITKSRQRKN